MAIDLGSNRTSLQFMAIVIELSATMLALIYGAGLLIPIVIAFILTNVLEALIEQTIERLKIPQPITVVISVIIVFFLIGAFVYIIIDQVDEFIAAWPRYLVRLSDLIDSAAMLLGKDVMTRVQTAVRDLNLIPSLSTAVGSASAILLNFGLVLLYAGFLLAERGRIFTKLMQLPRDPTEKENISVVLTAVSDGIR